MARQKRWLRERNKSKLLRCPTCGMLVRTEDEDFPFCSDRCRKIDLGKWAMGVYKISSPVLDPEVLEDLGNPTSGEAGDRMKSDGPLAEARNGRGSKARAAGRLPGPGLLRPSSARGSGSRGRGRGDRWRRCCCGRCMRGWRIRRRGGYWRRWRWGLWFRSPWAFRRRRLWSARAGATDPRFVVIDEVAGHGSR